MTFYCAIAGAAPSSWKFFDEMSLTMGHRPCVNNVSDKLAEVEAEGNYFPAHFIFDELVGNAKGM